MKRSHKMSPAGAISLRAEAETRGSLILSVVRAWTGKDPVSELSNKSQSSYHQSLGMYLTALGLRNNCHRPMWRSKLNAKSVEIITCSAHKELGSCRGCFGS
jgi:hypothetical protein